MSARRAKPPSLLLETRRGSVLYISIPLDRATTKNLDRLRGYKGRRRVLLAAVKMGLLSMEQQLARNFRLQETGRDVKGRFVYGGPGGPGRPRKPRRATARPQQPKAIQNVTRAVLTALLENI